MYVKVYASLWDGSMASDPFDTWALFLFLLAHADVEGFIEMTPEAISRRSGIPLDLVTAGLAKLESPDPRSRSREQDGRRLEPIDDRGWGWRIVNYLRYRNLRTETERRERNREKQARRRARRLDAGAPAAAVHGHTRRRTPGVPLAYPRVAPAYPQAEGEGEAEESLPLPSCVEPAKKTAAPRPPAVVTIPTTSNGEYPVTEGMVAPWREAFPAVDVVVELRKARAWCLANPTRRKTVRGVPRFLNSWLAHAQDRGGRAPGADGAESSWDRAEREEPATRRWRDGFSESAPPKWRASSKQGCRIESRVRLSAIGSKDGAPLGRHTRSRSSSYRTAS